MLTTQFSTGCARGRWTRDGRDAARSFCHRERGQRRRDRGKPESVVVTVRRTSYLPSGGAVTRTPAKPAI